jgi:hypothetical protein
VVKYRKGALLFCDCIHQHCTLPNPNIFNRNLLLFIMPENNRDRRVREEAVAFTTSRSSYPSPCNAYEPTMEELETTTFSDYIRKVVLRRAERNYVEYPTDDSRPLLTVKELIQSGPISYTEGMGRVTLPKEFREMASRVEDLSGRGPDFGAGSPLGDMELPSPINQCVRGIGGIYEYTFLDKPPISGAEFRDKADVYLKEQLGGRRTEYSVDELEQKFWKRLGPTMPPAMYGADMEGTLFNDEDGPGWNISKLSSCLQLLLSDQPDDHQEGIPGVTTPYLYFGMWASVFCAHTEDMNLLSINYLHAGAPKVWYAVAAGEDAQRLEQLCEGHYHQAKTQCPEYMRHKRCLISPGKLKKAGIRFTKAVQYPGDVMVTFPGSYHFGFNTGFNVAEATNFAVPEWMPYGRIANICLCRPDSVRIDMNKFERLILQYDKQVKRSRRITWKEWAIRLRKKRQLKEEGSQRSSPRKAKQQDEGQGMKRKQFWVEVMQPVAGKGSTFSKKTKKPTKKKGRKRSKDDTVEIWHLAKPGGRKSLRPETKVLSITPAMMDAEKMDDSSDEDEAEECFAGVIIEVRDNHVRVRFDGLTKRDDVWVPIDSPKLFLDGGIWDGTSESEHAALPPLHYWREEDSKRRCK